MLSLTTAKHLAKQNGIGRIETDKFMLDRKGRGEAAALRGSAQVQV